MNDVRLLDDRYEVGEVLGRGGMATVRRARDTRLGRDVAVKELRIDLASDSTFQERFRREAQASAGLNHPNIVSVYDTGEQIDPASHVAVPYIVMELIQGRTLRDILRDGRPILPRRALEFTLGVLDALAYSHRAGIVHRDIKPANVMITSTGTIKVMDFGIARAVSDTSSTMTQTAAVIGTAQYLSPEQARGETVDARSDLYSAGCLMYELLVGRPPFTGDSPVSVAYQHVREAPTPPSVLDSEVTPGMDAVVLRALAKAASDRYQSASEMSADIRRLLAGQPVQAPPPQPVPPRPDAAAGQPASAYSASAYSASTGVQNAIPGNTGQQSVITGPILLAPPPPAPRRMGWMWPFLTGILLVALVTGLFIWFMPRKTQVSVPAVKGFEQSAAEQMIRDRNLNPKVTKVQGPDNDTKNHVTDQNPAANTPVEPGSDVTITVNIGPDKVPLPSGIVGNDVNQVQAALVKAGFTGVKPVKAETEPPTAKANVVLKVEPAEGTMIAVGQEILLYYATGQAVVPNLRTYDCAIAAKMAINAGFTNPTSARASTSDLALAGTVSDTVPVPNTLANKADPLKIICYAYVPPPTTPPTTSSTAPTTPPPTSASPSPSPSP